MRSAVIALGIVALAAAPVRADAPAARDPDLARRSDRTRLYHQIAIVAMAGGYVLTEFVVKERLTGDCRWCDPPGFDRRVRDAMVWDDPERAALVADLTGYVAAPMVAIGLLWASVSRQPRGRRWYDDAAPVFEAAIAVGLFSQVAKFGVRRARPLARFGDPGRDPDLDDNVSFFSGHTALTFSLAIAAGTVAHRRGYKLEPVIWVSGLTLAATTGYLRIAADKHYLSDVVVGAMMGSAFGYLVPRFFHADVLGPDTALVPTGNGLALVGTF